MASQLAVIEYLLLDPPPVQLSSAALEAAPGDSEESQLEAEAASASHKLEQLRCRSLRDKLLAEFAHVMPDKLLDVDPAAPRKPGAVVHRIELKERAKPYSRPLRHMSTLELDELKKQLQEYIDSGRIRASESP